MQTSKFSTMAMMMNRNTQFKSLSQFPSKLFSWSTNSSATRCSSTISNSYPTTTAAPRIAPVNSKLRSYTHGRFSPSSFLQVSLGPGNLKFNVSCNSLLLQDLCFSTTQYELASKSVVDDEFGKKKNAADLEEKILLKMRVPKGGGNKSLTVWRYKPAAGPGYKCVSVTNMGLSEARIKYYFSTGGGHWDSEEEGNTDDDHMNYISDSDDDVSDEGGTGSTNSNNEMEVFYHSDSASTEESSTNAPAGGAPASPANENDNMENALPPVPVPVPEGNNQIVPPVPEGNSQTDPALAPPAHAPAANVNEPARPPARAPVNEPPHPHEDDILRGPFADLDSFKDFFD